MSEFFCNCKKTHEQRSVSVPHPLACPCSKADRLEHLADESPLGQEKTANFMFHGHRWLLRQAV